MTAWAACDNDGRLDVFIGNESVVTGAVFPSKPYLNSPGGALSEVANEAGMHITDKLSRKRYIIKGVTTRDYYNN